MKPRIAFVCAFLGLASAAGLGADSGNSGAGEAPDASDFSADSTLGLQSIEPQPTPTVAPVDIVKARARVVAQLQRLMQCLDQGDTATAQGLTLDLIELPAPVREAAATAVRVQVAEPALRARQLIKAAWCIRTMVQLVPDNANYFETLGTVVWNLGRRDLALEYVKRALALNPGSTRLKAKIKVLENVGR